jgi:hypothetical protein
MGVVNGIIAQQSAMIGYEYVFYWIGTLFAVCLPIIFLLRQPKKAIAPSEVLIGD